MIPFVHTSRSHTVHHAADLSYKLQCRVRYISQVERVKRPLCMWPQSGHGRPNNSTMTTAWRISFLLICTRLHEFELVPYIIINLPHKLRGQSFICLNNGAKWCHTTRVCTQRVCSGLPDRHLSITFKSHPNPVRPRRRLHDLIGSALSWPVLLSGPRGRALPSRRVRDPRGVMGQHEQHLIGGFLFFFSTHTYMSVEHGVCKYWKKYAVMLIQVNKENYSLHQIPWSSVI